MRISYLAYWTDKTLAMLILMGVVYLLWKMRKEFRIGLLIKMFSIFIALFFVMRIVLFGAFYPLFSSLTVKDLGYAFLQGLQFDLCAIATLGGIVLWALLIPVCSKRYYQVLAGLGGSIGVLILGACAGDLIYFSFVKRHTGTEILIAIYDMDLLASLVSANYWWWLVFLIVIAFVMIGGGVYWVKRYYKPPRAFTYKDGILLLLSLVLLFFAFRGRFGFRFKPLTINEAYTEGNMPRGHLALNGVFSIYKSISKKYAPVSSLVKSQEGLTISHQLLGSKQEKYIDPRYPLLRARERFNVAAEGYNLVMIVVESWQYRNTDFFAGTHYGATPYLDALARQGIVFDKFYASGQRSINGNGTIMSGVAQLQGLPYFSLGLEQYHFTGLASLLKQSGYRTIFAQPAPWNSAQVGMVAQITGFEEIYDKNDMYSMGEYLHPGFISDYDGLMLLADKLKDSDKPFFALFFTAAMHPPFAPIHHKFNHFGWKNTESGYLNALNYTDWSIGQFIEKLKEQGQYKHTIFMIVADHTLGWGENGSFEDRFHIPFLIHAPALFAASRVEQVGSQIDILPTVLDMLHISLPYAAMGNSVFDKQAEHFVFTSQDGQILGWIHNGQLVEHTGTATVKQGQEDEVNPQEVHNVLGINRAVYDLLRADKWAAPVK